MIEQLGAVEILADQAPCPSQGETSREKRTLSIQGEGFAMRSTSRDLCSVGLAVPLDELTRLPLPIVISPQYFESSANNFIDFHHTFHPERDLVHGNDADIALRRSRGQMLPRGLHEHYHKYFAGPEFPSNRQETFRSVVLACAGVVPQFALDFSGKDGSPRVVRLKEDTSQQTLVKSIGYESEKKMSTRNFYRAQIGMFFANYAVEQSIEQVISEKVIEEFLDTNRSDRRIQLGNLMLREGIRLAVEPVNPIHSDLKKHGLIKGRQTDLTAKVQDFFVKSRRKDYHVALDVRLRSSLSSSAA